jgi:hypothetical protein
MYWLAAIGIVWIIKDSYILKKPRDFLKRKSKTLSELLSCSQCLGFWVGVTFAIYFSYQNGFHEIILLYPFAVSAFCWIFDSLLDMIQEASVFFENKRKNNK